MKKKEIIKKSNDFTKIINKKENISNKYYSIYVEKSKQATFGISIPTKTGHAVVRNKIKRQIKSIIDKNNNLINNHYNYVIIGRKNLKDLNYLEKQEKILELFKRIGEKSNEK